jgi:hypothetical protein
MLKRPDKYYKKTSRRKKTYSSFPKSGRFRFHGAGKDYYRALREHQEGKRPAPPPFWEFVKEWRAAGYSLDKIDKKKAGKKKFWRR